MEATDSSRDSRRDGMVSRSGDGPTTWSRSSPPGWIESAGKSVFTWRKRCQAMAVLTRTWSASRRETRRRSATAIPLWIMQSTHSSSMSSGAWQERPLVRQWVRISLLTQWFLWCSSLKGSGRSSCHSSHYWWKWESSMVVGSEITGRASRSRIGACTLGRESQVSVRGGILFLSWLMRMVD